MTLSEHLEDYVSPEVKARGFVLVDNELEKVPKVFAKDRTSAEGL